MGTLVYLVLCSFWTMLTVFVAVGVKLILHGTQPNGTPVFMSAMDIVFLVSFLVVGIFAFCWFTFMSYKHLPLARQNMISIEKSYKNMTNPYDLGSFLLNMSQVMGAFGWDWLLPIM